jgi:hypothetical protein
MEEKLNARGKNLMEALKRELERNRELAKQYEEIGVPGQIGLMFIKADIQEAEKMIEEQDAVGMLRIYAKMKANK